MASGFSDMVNRGGPALKTRPAYNFTPFNVLLPMNFSDLLHSDPTLQLLANTARTTGVRAYLVGGYVRDLLLKRGQAKDIDVVCVGSGIDFAEQVARQIGPEAHCSQFKNFGTAQVLHQGLAIEFVGARKESYQRDSRKPIVEDGTLEEDQLRRDFTINALAISLNQADFGELIDPFGGLGHLKRKLLKTPLEPGVTFSDDPLRMMRAIRFATQLGFDIDPDTYEAIAQHRDRISIVSMERVVDELNKIILAKEPSYGFKLLFSSGLLHLIFPEMVALQGVDTIDGQSHKDNFYHTLKVLDNLCAYTDDLWLRWAAILHDIAKPATKRYYPKQGWTFHGHEERGAKMVPGIFRRFRLPMHEQMKFVQKLVRLHLRPIALSQEAVTDSAVRRLLFEAGHDIDALMKLCRADITSKDGNKVKRYLQNFDRVEEKIAEVEARDQIRNFQPIITGEVIMATFGLPPGRAIGEIKLQVRDAILDGHIRNEFGEAYPFMLATGQKLGHQPAKLLTEAEIGILNQKAVDE
jgi:putative nucleotidyltransferase with HDIG domain